MLDEFIASFRARNTSYGGAAVGGATYGGVHYGGYSQVDAGYARRW